MFDDYDSDDDFQSPKTTSRVSSKTKAKSKSKEKTSGKALTSSQMDPTPSKRQFMACLGLYPNGGLVARSGRAARMTAEEKRFQEELEEALKLSEEEHQSSAEIVPPDNSKREAAVEDITSKRSVEEEEMDGTTSKKARTQSEKKKVFTIGSSSEDEVYHPVPATTKRKTPVKKKAKKVAIVSSDDDESEEEVITSKKRNTPRTTRKKAVVSSEEEEEAENTGEPKKSPQEQPLPVSPLKDRNRKTGGSPEKVIITPRKNDPAPPLSSSLTKMLGKLNKPSPASPQVTGPSTPVQRKIPSWTPPAKVGTRAGTGSASSPVIGLRLGLSRKFKSKPLHTSVKTPH